VPNSRTRRDTADTVRMLASPNAAAITATASAECLAAGLMDIGAIVRASARPQRQYSASANGPKYSAVIGKTKFITPIG
jgi:hypothetical protein